MITVGLVLLLIHMASCFILDTRPCTLRPPYSGGIPADPDFTTTVIVDKNCRNGTFIWHYPRGHTVLRFQNPSLVQEVICFHDRLGGELFAIYDETRADEFFLGNITENNQVCTKTRREEHIVIRVHPMKEKHYIGAIDYTVTSRR